MELPRDGFLFKQVRRSSRNSCILLLSLFLLLGFFMWLSSRHWDGEGKWWFLICATLSAACLAGFVRIALQFQNPITHPVFKELARFGALDRMVHGFEAEILSPEAYIGGFLMTKSWIVQAGGMKTGITAVDDIVWIHSKTVSNNGIKSYFVAFYKKTGQAFEISCPKKDVEQILDVVSHRIPWVVTGYGPELIRLWKSNRPEFIHQVERRKADIGGDTGQTPVERPQVVGQAMATKQSAKTPFLLRYPFAQKVLWASCIVLMPLAIAFGLTKTHERLEERIAEGITKGYVERKETPPQLEAGFLRELCVNPEYSGENFCVDDSRILLARQVLVWSAMAGFILFVFISFIGLVGCLGRDSLVLAFSVGIYVSLIAGALLLLASGLALTYTVYIAEVVYAESFHPQIVLVVGLVTLGGAFALIRPAFQMTQKAHNFIIGKRLTPEEYPTLWSFVRNAANRLGALLPDSLIVGVGTEFYVTESNVTCLEEKLKGRALFLSLPILRRLSTSELQAIVGHELGHFRGSDTLYSQRFYPIYKSAHQGLESLRLEDGTPNYLLLPVYALFAYFMDEFSRIESSIGRKRELMADKAAAELTSDAVAASALAKIYAYSTCWTTIQNRIFHLVKQGNQLTNCSLAFSEHIDTLSRDQLLQIMHEEQRIPHPTDTHPPLEVRLNQLGVKMSDCLKLLEPTGEPAASLLDGHLEALELELNGLEHGRVFQLTQPKSSK